MCLLIVKVKMGLYNPHGISCRSSNEKPKIVGPGSMPRVEHGVAGNQPIQPLPFIDINTNQEVRINLWHHIL